MRRRRQAEVDQGELWWVVQLAQQALDLRTRVSDAHVVVLAQNKVERIGNQRIVIDNEQIRLSIFCESVHVCLVRSAFIRRERNNHATKTLWFIGLR